MKNPILPPSFDHISAEEFDRERSRCVERLRKTGRPAVMTVDADDDLVILSADAYRRLLERLETAEESVGIYRGIESARRGEGIPLDEAFRQIRESARERRRTA